MLKSDIYKQDNYFLTIFCNVNSRTFVLVFGMIQYFFKSLWHAICISKLQAIYHKLITKLKLILLMEGKLKVNHLIREHTSLPIGFPSFTPINDKYK